MSTTEATIPQRASIRLPLLRLWGLSFAILVPVSTAAIAVALSARVRADLPVSPLLAANILLDWTLWALLVPAIVWLARRFPLDSGPYFKGVVQHFFFGAAVTAIELMLFTTAEWFVINPFAAAPTPAFMTGLWVNISFWYPYGLLVYWIIAIATQAFETSRRSREQELEAAHLREELTRAQLTTLRMQLNPHFLCNTLNTASVFMRDGRSEDAIEVVVSLGDLLNHTLDSMDTPEVTLKEELEFIDRYLEIERKRFSDRLQTRVSVEESLLEARVPNMILQPLVENAIRHGLAGKRGGGCVEITANTRNGDLEITVLDDGPGFGGSSRRNRGVGLDNTARRIERLYGGAGALDLGNRDAGGAIVTITLPLRREASTGAGYDLAS